jgi:hypothetical protein
MEIETLGNLAGGHMCYTGKELVCICPCPETLGEAELQGWADLSGDGDFKKTYHSRYGMTIAGCFEPDLQ